MSGEPGRPRPATRGELFRERLEELRAFPATTALAAIWVVVYLAMLAVRDPAGVPKGMQWLGVGGIDVLTTHAFGDATGAEIARGQVWRAETAALIHYGVLHIGMNLLGLWQLGRLVESWYGGGPTLCWRWPSAAWAMRRRACCGWPRARARMSTSAGGRRSWLGW